MEDQQKRPVGHLAALRIVNLLSTQRQQKAHEVNKNVEVAYTDGDQFVIYNKNMDNEMNERIPWDYENINREELIKLQKAMPEYELGVLNENDYIVIDDVLYTLKSPPNQTEFPRIVLPKQMRHKHIVNAHKQVGHQAVKKTLQRLQEWCKWDGQLKDVINVLRTLH